MTVVTDSNFRNKILMPILFDNATKLPTFPMPEPRKKMNSETTERKKKRLFETVRDFHKRTDEANKQSLALNEKNRSQLLQSATKIKDKLGVSRSSQLFTPRRKGDCSRSAHRTPEHEPKRYVTNIQKLQLINEIEMRKVSKQLKTSEKPQQMQPGIRRSNTNIYYLDFEKQIPKLGDLRWLVETEQINQEKLQDIKKKLQTRGIKVHSLAERREEQANEYIKRYMQMIDVEGIDEKHVAATQQLDRKYKQMDGFLDQLKKKQVQRDQRFKTVSQSVKSIDGRLNQNRYEHVIPEIEMLMRRTSEYQVWKDIANRDIREDIKGLVGVLKQSEQENTKHNIVLELLRQSRMAPIKK